MKIIRFKDIESTNSELKLQAEKLYESNQLAENLYAIVAEKQILGKGRVGRTWVSPAGGLYLSFICKNSYRSNPALMNFLVGVIVFDEIEKIIVKNQKLTLKWPNDIYIGDKKLGGILIETFASQFDYLIVGIGVNVCFEPLNKENSENNVNFDKMPDIATGLGLGTYEKEFLLNGILESFENKDKIEFLSNKETLIAEFSKRSLLSKCLVLEYSSSQYKIRGKFTEIDENGFATICDESGNFIKIQN